MVGILSELFLVGVMDTLYGHENLTPYPWPVINGIISVLDIIF